jgi:hypothetical protein
MQQQVSAPLDSSHGNSRGCHRPDEPAARSRCWSSQIIHSRICTVTLCHHLSRRNGQHRRIRDLTGRRLCGVRRRTALRHCRSQIVGRKRANDPQVDVRDLTRPLESLPTIRGGAKFKEIVPPTLCEATNNRSKTFARHVCATVIAVFTSCYVVKAGTSTRRGHVAFIASWVCNCATK